MRNHKTSSPCTGLTVIDKITVSGDGVIFNTPQKEHPLERGVPKGIGIG